MVHQAMGGSEANKQFIKFKHGSKLVFGEDSDEHLDNQFQNNLPSPHWSLDNMLLI